jgi:anti-anti-sigma regulatory factor
MSEPYELPAELNIYNALDTRDKLLAWASEQNAKATDFLTISARNVGEVDGAGLQLLAALSNLNQAWQLTQPSAAFIEACETMGFGHWLESGSQSASTGAKL